MSLAQKPKVPGAAARAPWTDPQAKPFIRIKNVTKKFGDFVAVNDVSLDIYRSELFCLLGGSGSGKSTLLRMLAGFEQPTSGAIEIDGQNMAGTPPYDRPVNMMFQSYALFPHMTVADNIAYGLKQDGVAKAERDERVAEMLRMVKLEPYGKRKPHQLSGGQRQRVALARALAKRPKLLLLDEPLGALDKKLREETQFELVGIQEKLGTTFIVVTHDQEEAMTLATRIGVMNQGQITQVGEPREIYEYPRSRFVANFIGDVNMFEGRILVDGVDHAVIQSDEAGAQIRIGYAVPGREGDPIAVAVRPEKILMGRERPADLENVLSGVVEDISYLGGLSHYRIKLASGKRVRITQTNRDRHEDPITWDEPVFLSWETPSSVALSS